MHKHKIHINIIHIALKLILIFLEQGINSAKSMFFGRHFKIPGWIFFIFMFLHSYKAYAHECTWIWLCTSQKSRSILRLGVRRRWLGSVFLTGKIMNKSTYLKQFRILKNHQKIAKFWLKMKKIDFSFLIPHFLKRNFLYRKFSYRNSSITRFSGGIMMRTNNVKIYFTQLMVVWTLKSILK